ncbi:MAG: hypothetical protein KC621_12640, partial [Myxococcales bacterium]|nr:hypothetical protein [Myxococcales bacterium]
MSVLLLALQAAMADSPLTLRESQTGSLAASFPGVALARDTNADGRADTLAQPGAFTVQALPTGVGVELARLYWSASRGQVGADCSGTPDNAVTLDVPGLGVQPVTASSCVCSAAGDPTYDVWSCWADVQGIVESGDIAGTYRVSDLSALVNDADGHNASAGLALWVSHPSFPTRAISLYDGLQTLQGSTSTLVPGGFEAAGTSGSVQLAVYALDGDVGSSPGEQINIETLPSGNTLGLVDASSPFNDAFNGTITTGATPSTGNVGVDLDLWDLSPAFTPGDTSVSIEVGAGSDRVWLVAEQLAVATRDPDLGTSTLTFSLLDDSDGNGEVSPADTLRFTAVLTNSGPEAATFAIVDPMPPWTAAWTLIDAGTGTNASVGNTLRVNGITLGPGQSTLVRFDLVVGTPADGTVHTDVATYTAPLEGGTSGQIVASPLTVRVDSDLDGVFDSEDLCPGGSDTVDSDGDTVPNG